MSTPDHPLWADGVVQTLVFVVSMIAAAAALRRVLPPLRTLGMPDALLAGVFGLLLGPSVLGVLPFDPEVLESVVYHGLGLVFVAVSLQSPPREKRGTSLTAMSSFAFAIPFIAVIQGFVGLSVVLAWNSFVGPLHPGVGMMLPLGFNQGPGAALTLGDAWERGAGFESGAQIGLLMAALGFAFCIGPGVALIAFGRRHGWADDPGTAGAEAVSADAEGPKRAREQTHGLEPLSAQVVAIACVYAVTLAFLWFLTGLLPKSAATIVWGFHFLFASGFAVLARNFVAAMTDDSPLDDELLGRTSSVVVDVTTAGALAAISVEVLGRYLAPILVIGSVGGIVTLLVCVWLARRAFPSAPFQHAAVLYGAMTGTTPTGLALLRMLDPELRGNVARNYVFAATASALLALPLFALMPIPVEGAFPRMTWIMLPILLAYALVLVLVWWRTGALRFMRPLGRLWPLGMLVFFAACDRKEPTTNTPETTEPAPADEGLRAALVEAGDGVENAELAVLLREHWRFLLESSPTFATQLAVHDFDAELASESLAAIADRDRQRNEFLARAKTLAAGQLSAGDRTHLEMFIEEQESDLATSVCESHTWSFSARNNPITTMSYFAAQHPTRDARDLERLLARYRRLPVVIDEQIANLRIGLGKGRVNNAESVTRVIAMVDREMAKPTASWALLEPAKDHPEIAAAMVEEIDRSLRPALGRYAAFLRNELLPAARSDEKAGLVHLDVGKACYAATIRKYTTLDLTPEQIHETGLAEMKRINAEMRVLGKKLFGTSDLRKILTKLRSDPKLHFSSEDEVEAFASNALASAKAAMPKWFGRLPKADCVVERIPDYEAPFTTIAYYREPQPGGRRPGTYFINTYEPTTRPRYEAFVLALHEERAIAALPALAPDMKVRRRGYEAARKIIRARGELTPRQVERLRRVAKILELEEKPAQELKSA